MNNDNLDNKKLSSNYLDTNITNITKKYNKKFNLDPIPINIDNKISTSWKEPTPISINKKTFKYPI